MTHTEHQNDESEVNPVGYPRRHVFFVAKCRENLKVRFLRKRNNIGNITRAMHDFDAVGNLSCSVEKTPKTKK
jgi:hypothetical protein